MRSLKARVENGRYVIDTPSPLPDGAEVRFQLIDDDDLDEHDRAALHASLDEGFDDADAGRVISEEESLARLQAL